MACKMMVNVGDGHSWSIMYHHAFIFIFS